MKEFVEKIVLCIKWQLIFTKAQFPLPEFTGPVNSGAFFDTRVDGCQYTEA